ncbi:YIP1 family protein [Bacillus marasmi]|uniref:YIP1 family protein n=1 Tax=Bacillus marasmi TaxID=1926279 RepID=UPI0011CAC920|nr:YIP1 family protein [Bacillus marasmi]
MQAEVNLEEVKTSKKPNLFGMLFSPSLQFERMKVKAPIALPLIMMMIFAGITSALVAYISLGNPILQENEELAELGIDIPVGVTLGMGAATGVIGVAIGFLLVALFYKVAMMIIGNDTTFKTLFSLVVHVSIISTVGLLLNGLIALAIGGYEPYYTSLAPLFVDNQLIHTIAVNFDIIHVWYYVVFALGLQAVAGLSKKQAITVVIIEFIIGVGFSSIGAFFAI